MVWDRKDYLKEAEKQFGDQETYQELLSDPVSPLISIVIADNSHELRREVIYLMKLCNTFL